MTPSEFITGRLSAAEDARIVELSERGLTGGQIALRLNRNPKTIVGALYRLGLRAPVYRTYSQTRGGKVCRPFTPAEDAFIEAQAQTGIPSTWIVPALEKEFGHRRSSGTIRMRLQMIAARDEVAA